MCVPHSPGNQFLIGAHDRNNCEESDGCYKVTIVEVWTHEDYLVIERPGDDAATADISVIRSVDILLVRIYAYSSIQSAGQERTPGENRIKKSNDRKR